MYQLYYDVNTRTTSDVVFHRNNLSRSLNVAATNMSVPNAECISVDLLFYYFAKANVPPARHLTRSHYPVKMHREFQGYRHVLLCFWPLSRVLAALERD